MGYLAFLLRECFRLKFFSNPGTETYVFPS